MVPYFPLSDDVLRRIVILNMHRIRRRISENYKAEFIWDDAVIDGIASRCQEVESGARNIEHILTRGLLPELSGHFLARMGEGASISRVQVSIDEGGAFGYSLT